jgi:hypothetical protein
MDTFDNHESGQTLYYLQLVLYGCDQWKWLPWGTNQDNHSSNHLRFPLNKTLPYTVSTRHQQRFVQCGPYVAGKKYLWHYVLLDYAARF